MQINIEEMQEFKNEYKLVQGINTEDSSENNNKRINVNMSSQLGNGSMMKIK